MIKHQYFDLCLHEDLELAELLGEPIDHRITLHEWPLSCVQSIMTKSGQRIIYKSTSGPSLETEFAAAASSPLLTAARSIYHERGYRCLLIEFIDAPLLQESITGRRGLAAAGVKLAQQIDAIQGELPCYLDIRGAGRWHSFRGALLKALEGLVRRRLYTSVTPQHIARLATGMSTSMVEEAVNGRQAYLHGDLTPDNIFVTDRGVRVIDWQRPLRGPALIDRVQLLEAAGFEPVGANEQGAALIGATLKIHWFLACTLRWFPAGRKTYDSSVATLIDKAERLSHAPTRM